MHQANLQPLVQCELQRVSGRFIYSDRLAEGKMLFFFEDAGRLGLPLK